MKKLKRIIAVVLCMCLLVSSASVLSFAESDTEMNVQTANSASAADYPIVFVTGIGQSYSYFYENEEDAKEYYDRLEEVKNGKTTYVNEDGETVEYRETDGAKTRWNLFCNDFSFAFKEIGTYPALFAVVGGLLASVVGINLVPEWAVDKIVNTLFRYNIIDENGQLPANVITPRAECSVADMTAEQKENFYRSTPCQDIVGDIGEDMIYCFNYSAFSFTYDNADDLNDFINNIVLPQTGKDKVVLVPMSMGASVVSAYLQRYGTQKDASGSTVSKVAHVVSIVGAWDGSDVFADLIELKYAEDAPEKLYNGIVADLIGEPWGYLVNGVLRIFPKRVLRSIIDEILNSIVENLVMKTPSLLALIPHERYPAIREARLEGNEDLAYIMEMTDEYYECQCGLRDRLTSLSDNYGVDFYYIAGYGLGFGGFSSDYEFFQFLASADTTNSDEIIQISSTATGATFAPHGTELESYNSDYVTPDKSVDISTCIFPDNIWLFYCQKHELENNNTALKLALDLACGNDADARRIYPKINGSRDLKKLTRDYLPDLQKWLEIDGNSLTDEQQSVVDDVYAMMDSVVNDREKDDQKIQNLYDMMCDLGIYQKSEESEPDFFTKLMKGVNDKTYDIFGAKGYVDILSFSK